jgi:hypothetical protein
MHSSFAFHRYFWEAGIEGRKTMINKNSNWKWNLLVIAAGVAVSAVSASAQEATLTANVPFAFSINRVILEPGSYDVARQGHVVWFRSEETGRAVALVNAIGTEGKADEKPSLTFDCVRSHCYIRAIHAGYGVSGAEVPAPKLSKSDKEELAVVNVPLEPIRGE